MLYPLNGSFAKVKRANKHIQDLQRDLAVFLNQRPYTVRFEKDSDAGIIRLIARASKFCEPPINFALLAGEVAHQLRSALDHAVYDLCSIRYRRPPKHLTQFPIFETLDGYKSRGIPKIKDIPKSASTLIKKVQPYHRRTAIREDPLWMLHDLNNTDKHRLIPVVVMGGKEVTVRDDGSWEEHGIVFDRGFLPLKDRIELLTMRIPEPDLTTEKNPQLTCNIAFEQVGDAKFKPIIPLLRQLSSRVHGILSALSDP